MTKKLVLAPIAAGGLVAGILGLAPSAAAAPVESETAQETVNRLESEGYHVIVTKFGSASLEQCTVEAVRPGQPVTEVVPNMIGDDRTQRVVEYTTVYVDARC